jgi:C4-dicarboxylate transporter, DctQ subunit
LRALLAAYEKTIVALAAAAGTIIVATFVIVVYDASLRNLGFRTIDWAIPVSEYGLLYVTLLAAPWLLRTKRQVVAESVRVLLPETARRVLEVGIYVFCVLICLVMVWFAAGQTVDAWQRGDVEQRGIALPLYLAYAPFVVSFFFMGIEFVRLLCTGQTIYTISATVEQKD